jgi:hypothetical protein
LGGGEKDGEDVAVEGGGGGRGVVVVAAAPLPPFPLPAPIHGVRFGSRRSAAAGNLRFFLARSTASRKLVFGPAQHETLLGPHVDGGIFLYIYFVTILQKYMVRYKFNKNINLLPWATA